MNILVTGGAGFIGSHLVERLSKDNKVVVLDNLLRGSKLKLNNNIKLINNDIKNIEAVKSSMDGCDVVYHLAAFLGVDEVAKIQ